MNHNKVFISFLDSLCNNTAAYIASVNKIIFISPVTAAYERFADKAADLAAPCAYRNFEEVCCNITAVDIVNNVFKTHIARCVQLCLTVVYKLKRNFRV